MAQRRISYTNQIENNHHSRQARTMGERGGQRPQSSPAGRAAATARSSDLRVMRNPGPNPWMDGDLDIDFLHEIASRMSLAPPLHEVLREVMRFAAAVVQCDSCFVYVLEKDELVLRASKNPHPEIIDRLKLKIGEGITGWVAEHREPVAVALNAMKDPRFKLFNDLPEDHFEAFLSVPG